MPEFPAATTVVPVVPVVCAVLVDRTARILAVQRSRQRSLGGRWEFPGGKVGDGEPPETALLRELREELDLAPDALGPLLPMTRVVHSYEFATIALIPYLARCLERPPLRLLEHADHAWVTLAEAGDLEWAPADLPVLGELGRLLGGA